MKGFRCERKRKEASIHCGQDGFKGGHKSGCALPLGLSFVSPFLRDRTAHLTHASPIDVPQTSCGLSDPFLSKGQSILLSGRSSSRLPMQLADEKACSLSGGALGAHEALESDKINKWTKVHLESFLRCSRGPWIHGKPFGPSHCIYTVRSTFTFLLCFQGAVAKHKVLQTSTWQMVRRKDLKKRLQAKQHSLLQEGAIVMDSREGPAFVELVEEKEFGLHPGEMSKADKNVTKVPRRSEEVKAPKAVLHEKDVKLSGRVLRLNCSSRS